MPRILIIDDEQDLLGELSEVLAENGYEVDTALNGHEALKKIEAFQPQIMLLDIAMPEMDGLETLRRAKEVDPNLHVVMVRPSTRSLWPGTRQNWGLSPTSPSPSI